MCVWFLDLLNLFELEVEFLRYVIEVKRKVLVRIFEIILFEGNSGSYMFLRCWYFKRIVDVRYFGVCL